MTETWNTLCLYAGDALLGWTLALPRDATLVLLAAMTAVGMLVIRCLFSNGARLRLIQHDVRRLRELKREARSRGDTVALDRVRRVRSIVARAKIQEELKPMLAALLPLAGLFTWGQQRLDYLPLRQQDPIHVRLTTPASATDQIVHLVPQEGLECDGGWVRILSHVPRNSAAAEWVLRATGTSQAYLLRFRHREHTAVHAVRVGSTHYDAPRRDHQNLGTTEITHQTYRPFGCVPGILVLNVPPWAVAFLGVVAVMYLGGKRACGVP